MSLNNRLKKLETANMPKDILVLPIYKGDDENALIAAWGVENGRKRYLYVSLQMKLKARLVKLESTMLKPSPIRITRFVMPESPNPLGYVCGNTTIMRVPGESLEALHKRCMDSVIWPDFTYCHIFEPLEGVCH